MFIKTLIKYSLIVIWRIFALFYLNNYNIGTRKYCKYFRINRLGAYKELESLSIYYPCEVGRGCY